jgi:DNA-binding protein
MIGYGAENHDKPQQVNNMVDNQANPQGAKGLSDTVVYIGKKPTMNYVLAVVTQFNNGAKEVAIKARGNAISRAVDVAEIVRKRFLQDAKDPSHDNIRIGSEELMNEDGTKSKVSYIQISAYSGGAQPQQQPQDGVIYIGKKPTMNYVLAVVTQVNSGMPGVMIKARGNAISKAVDVVEITRSRFLPIIKDPSSEGIQIKSEELMNEDGTKSKISSIQITIKR